MPDLIKSAVAVLECDIATAKAQDTLFAFIKIDDLQLVLEALTTMQEREATLIMEREWQPIETAPKDGTRVLLWIMPTRIAMPFEWKDGRWMGDDYPLNMAVATHWMPMPEGPPEDEARRKWETM